MNALLMHVELALIFFFTIVAWLVSGSALRLRYRQTGSKLGRHAGRLIGGGMFVTLLAAAVAAAVATLALTSSPVFWLDRLLLHVPLIAIPVALLWTHAMPRLRAIARAELNTGAAEPPAAASVSAAAEPALTVPYRLAALGSLTALYFCFRPPVPFKLSELVIPIVLLLIAAGTTWRAHAAAYRRITSSESPPIRAPWAVRFFKRLGILGMVAGLAAVPFYLAKQASVLPADIDMSAMVMEDGFGAPIVHASHGEDGHGGHGSSPAGSKPAPALSVADLTGPQEGTPDQRITLTAKQAVVTLASGKTVEAWTYNGQIPGPELRLRQGELVEVTLVNEDIADGATIHWHGLDVPNAEDGVAGATQDAVMPGESHTYRFVAEQAGTFWYHSHQHSKEAVQRGLFGPLVVEPADGQDVDTDADADAAIDVDKSVDITVMTHLWDDAGLAIGDSDIVRRASVAPGTTVRMRLINTDDWVLQSYELHGAPYRVVAVDGTPLGAFSGNRNALLSHTRLSLTTGGRYDIEFVMPDRPVFLAVGHARKLGVLMSPDGGSAMPQLEPVTAEFDPLHYGEPAELPWPIDEGFDRSFEIVLDNKLGFYNGELNMLYTMNGEVFPDTPMLMVREGELVKTTIVNRGNVDHPMHLHGHHMLVLAKNGEDATGSPWWSDTLDVRPGDVYEVAFLANNPGLWMDHCHNLTHAAIGMTMHLMYEGVYSPYRAGTDSGNHPE
jgi:FtsP/CotA-like multicopper oxidase with cupredoxin domain